MLWIVKRAEWYYLALFATPFFALLLLLTFWAARVIGGRKIHYVLAGAFAGLAQSAFAFWSLEPTDRGGAHQYFTNGDNVAGFALMLMAVTPSEVAVVCISTVLAGAIAGFGYWHLRTIGER